jgi:hypothetical protein
MYRSGRSYFSLRFRNLSMSSAVTYRRRQGPLLEDSSLHRCRNPCSEPDLKFNIQTCRPKKLATMMITTTTPMM